MVFFVLVQFIGPSKKSLLFFVHSLKKGETVWQKHGLLPAHQAALEKN